MKFTEIFVGTNTVEKLRRNFNFKIILNILVKILRKFQKNSEALDALQAKCEVVLEKFYILKRNSGVIFEKF